MTLYATSTDTDNELAVQRAAGEAWGCEMVSFGPMNPVDGYITKEGRVTAVYEIKCRSNIQSQYPTVYLALRKWFDLTRSALSFDVKPLFFVGWTDQIGWIDVREIDARRLTLGGRGDVRSTNDREPLIEVPIEQFGTLAYR